MLAQQFGGAYGQIVFGFNALCGRVQDDLSVITRLYAQFIAQINERENAFQRVIAIGQTPNNPQIQIEFGGRWVMGQVFRQHGLGFQSVSCGALCGAFRLRLGGFKMGKCHANAHLGIFQQQNAWRVVFVEFA